MATPAEAYALAEAHRVAQNRRAALVAALVLQWWRRYVSVDDPSSVQRWLDLMVPRIMTEYERSGRVAQTFYGTLRKLEVPNAPAFTPLPPPAVVEAAIRTSLSVTGPVSVAKKLETFDKMTISEAWKRIDDVKPMPANLDRKMYASLAQEKATVELAGATVRHVLNGGRGSVIESTKADRVALGWVRITKADPCYFCAMLASRGLDYDGMSFDASDPRFIGPGDAKVHDHCGCNIKQVYSEEDEGLRRAREFEEMWREFSTGGGKKAITTFRQGYEGRVKVA